MESGLVSIIIPTRNRASLLGEAVRSAQSQSYDRIEILIVDDAGEDETPALVQRLSSTDSRIRFWKLPERKGAPYARNLAVRESNGEFIQFLDSDDLLHPEKVRVQIGALSEHPDHDLAVCQVGLFRNRPGDTPLLWNRLEGDPLLRFLKHDNPWVTINPLWRRSALERFGAWDESLPSSQDYEHATRVLILGAKALLHRHLLGFYRLHGGPTIGSEAVSERDEVHLRVFEMLLGDLREHNALGIAAYEEMAQNFLWVAERALHASNYALAAKALSRAAEIDPDSDRASKASDLAAALVRGASALCEVSPSALGIHYDRSVREDWWGHVTSAHEPLLPIPAAPRYRRRMP